MASNTTKPANVQHAPDVLSFFLPLAWVSLDAQRRLDGRECARCGSTAGLRPGGHAVTPTPDGGSLGWAVRVCQTCPPASAVCDSAAAVAWVVAAGAVEDDVLTAWRWRRSVAVPTGRLWDVVRVTRSVGLTILSRLPQHVRAVGPVLEVPARETVEFLVPRGTAATWPGVRGVFCVGAGGASRLPSPGMSVTEGRRARCGRRWLTRLEPHRTPTTHGGGLLECLLTELPRR
ncbi:hypothetical protein [Streptomyces millisiae]|uniref:Uncharacterized protein n=1 Tax=Streptomyces millisiae TaxID=3075542 RepID=A0ABU2LRT8_9ACTN|nr:hypothetical protein [Streptomyces sp. DSM 44918]MDT0320304.1 hypothetical protein [Streptomyces sp. DSM 44918]